MIDLTESIFYDRAAASVPLDGLACCLLDGLARCLLDGLARCLPLC
jgi:hypothetical protein